LGDNFNEVEIRISKCELKLREIDYAIDDLTPQTPPDKWQSILNEFENLKKTHLSLGSRYAKLVKAKREELNIPTLYQNTVAQNTLKRSEELIEKLSVRIKRTEERYSVGRSKWEKHKSKYVEHLVKCLQEAGTAKELIYTDPKVLVCINSVVMMSESVTITVGAYLTEPPTGESKPGFLMWSEHMRGTLAYRGFTDNYIRSRIYAYDMDSVSLGYPIRTKLNQLFMINGFVVVLTYDGKPKTEAGGLKIVIEQSAFNSTAEVQFEIPSDKIIFIPDTTTVDDYAVDSTVEDTVERLPKRLEIIECQREGMHLQVPTVINLHGSKVKTDMLLDTGASISVISRQLYSKGKTIPTEKLPKQRIQTANGLIECPVDILEVSTTAYARKVEVAIIDDCMPLLGANYFARQVFTVDLDNECIYIHPRRE
jgi:hypothetical protein